MATAGKSRPQSSFTYFWTKLWLPLEPEASFLVVAFRLETCPFGFVFDSKQIRRENYCFSASEAKLVEKNSVFRDSDRRNQTMNQIMNQSMNQTINQTMNQTMNRTMNQTMIQTMNQPLNQTLNKTTHQTWIKQ